MATVEEALVTWTWTRSQPTKMALGDGAPPLARKEAYAASFGAANQSQPWVRPWLDDQSFSKYWQASFNAHYELTDGLRAWRALTPLREAAPPTAATSIPGCSLACRRYLLPVGVAVELTARLSQSMTPAELLEWVAAVASGPAHVSLPGTPPLKLIPALARLLDEAETADVGRLDPLTTSGAGPLTLATVTSGTGWADEVTEGDESHRLLEGLCRHRPDPLAAGYPLPVLDQTRLPVASSFVTTTRYRSGDGAAIWSPARFGSGGARGLTCYHNNVSLSMLRADVMTNALTWAAAQKVMTPAVTELVRACVVQLSLLWGLPERGVYRSELVRHQISLSGVKPILDQLRTSLNVGPPLS